MASSEHLEVVESGVEAWNYWRMDNPTILPDLSGADLGDTNLSGANLIQVNLANANLDHATLDFANLRSARLNSAFLYCASLCHACLICADLRDANMSFSNLASAELKGAILWGTNLTSAQLVNADFSRANFSQTILTDVDLSDVSGLGRVTHAGPSSMGIDTLMKSECQIPRAFLRGCGVPEEFLRHAASSLNQAAQFYSCFISYGHEDKTFAQLLHDRLQGHRIRCWLDEHQLLPGDDLHESIDRGIRLWDKVLLCASKSSLTSWWVDGEINRAFQKEAQIVKERCKKVLALIPLNLDGFLFSADYQSGKKGEITSRVAANFVGWQRDHALFDRELEKVIRALRADDSGREKPPPARL